VARGRRLSYLKREVLKTPTFIRVLRHIGAEPDIVRAEIFKAFGYYVTEASFIMAYFVPYFRKKNRPELLERFKLENSQSSRKAPKKR